MELTLEFLQLRVQISTFHYKSEGCYYDSSKIQAGAVQLNTSSSKVFLSTYLLQRQG